METERIKEMQDLNQHEEITLERLNSNISLMDILDNFCRKKKDGEVRYGDGETEYVIRVEQGKIISVEETRYDDDDGFSRA